jgi:hypothetical protein
MLRERDPVMVALLGFVTCGLYMLVWKFQTTGELRAATGDATLSPTTDLLLTVVTCGLWGVYTDYRNARILGDIFRRCGVARDDVAWVVLVLDLLGLYAISPFLLQREINAACSVRALPG